MRTELEEGPNVSYLLDSRTTVNFVISRQESTWLLNTVVLFTALLVLDDSTWSSDV